jgi:3-isopropylmalate dehydrogenase
VLREDLKDIAAGKMGYSTSEVGDLVKEFIEKDLNQS